MKYIYYLLDTRYSDLDYSRLLRVQRQLTIVTLSFQQEIETKIPFLNTAAS